jgi:hypothetical protein
MPPESYVLQTEPMQPLLQPPPPRVPTWTRASGLLCAAYVAGVHLGLCDVTYKDVHYLGAAFAIGALLLIIGASIATAGHRFGRTAASAAWVADSVVMLAALVAFVLSRTTGLPGYHHTDWPVEQLVAIVAEAGYLVLTVIALRLLATPRSVDDPQPEGQA